MSPHSRPFVFLDPHGKRWPRLRRTVFVLGILLFLAVVWFVGAIAVKPDLRLPKNVRTAKGQLKALVRHAPAHAAQNPVKATWQKFFPASPEEKQRLAKQREQVHPRVPKTVMEIQLGFYENWDA